jgi:oxygen-dependent protoporphyrinogen oxidase
VTEKPPSPGRIDTPGIAIIGGGIAGLAAAHRLSEIAPKVRVTLFEAADRLGGVLATESRDGYLIERSADMFVTQPPWAADLCGRIGLGDELVGTDDRYRKAYVVRRGKLLPVPAGFALLQPARLWPLFKSPILSWRGKLRIGLEYFLPRRPWSTGADDESLASFARRRLGREAYLRLVQPLVGGIYTADPEQLSLAATLPRFLEMEHEYRSLIRAAWQERKSHPRMKAAAPGESASGARYGMFVAPRQGMKSLVDALARAIPEVDVRLNSPIERLERTAEGRWRISPGPAAASARADFDAVIIATPAHAAAGLLAAVDRALAEKLRAIAHASTAVVCLGYRRSQIEHPLDGFGCVVPSIEARQILAASFASVKFPGRAAADRVLIRVFIGGALQPELLERDDVVLQRLACRELGDLIGARGEPEVALVVRWSGAMPQYHVGHLDRVTRIEAAVSSLPGLQLAGSAYRGVGIPHCIHSGQQAAERVVQSLQA